MQSNGPQANSQKDILLIPCLFEGWIQVKRTMAYVWPQTYAKRPAISDDDRERSMITDRGWGFWSWSRLKLPGGTASIDDETGAEIGGDTVDASVHSGCVIDANHRARDVSGKILESMELLHVNNNQWNDQFLTLYCYQVWARAKNEEEKMTFFERSSNLAYEWDPMYEPFHWHWQIPTVILSASPTGSTKSSDAVVTQYMIVLVVPFSCILLTIPIMMWYYRHIISASINDENSDSDFVHG